MHALRLLSLVLATLPWLGSAAGATRREPPVTLSHLRVGVGRTWHIGAQDHPSDFIVDVIAGVVLFWPMTFHDELPQSGGPILLLDVGYHHNHGEDAGGHLFTAGLGAGYALLPWVSVAYVPRFVVGEIAGQRALGIRNGLRVEGALFSVEVAHQLLDAGGARDHQLLFLFAWAPTPFMHWLFKDL